jgi:hypothetical protein
VAGGGLYGSEAVSMRTAEGFSDVIKRQAELPVFTSPPEPDCAADIVASNSQRWDVRFEPSMDSIVRTVREGQVDGTFADRMSLVCEFQLSRLREIGEGVWAEPFLDLREFSDEELRDRWRELRVLTNLYEKLPVPEGAAALGRRLVRDVVRRSPLSSFGVDVECATDLLMAAPSWHHGDVHRGNVRCGSDGEVVFLDHEWMAVTGRGWANVPVLAGFSVLPLSQRMEIAGVTDDLASFVVAYAARFPGVLERSAPASDELAELLRTVLPCQPFGSCAR